MACTVPSVIAATDPTKHNSHRMRRTGTQRSASARRRSGGDHRSDFELVRTRSPNRFDGATYQPLSHVKAEEDSSGQADVLAPKNLDQGADELVHHVGAVVRTGRE